MRALVDFLEMCARSQAVLQLLTVTFSSLFFCDVIKDKKMADLTFFEFVFKEFSYFPVTLCVRKHQSEDIFAMLCRCE